MRPESERPFGAEREHGDEGVADVAQLAVAMRSDAVATVAVVVESRRAERHVVAARERGADDGEHRMRDDFGTGAAVGESGIVDHPVVHEPPMALPRHRVDDDVEHGVGTLEEPAAHVDPAPGGELDALPAGRRVQRHCA